MIPTSVFLVLGWHETQESTLWQFGPSFLFEAWLGDLAHSASSADDLPIAGNGN